jgi:hypothetical protein
MRPTLNRAILAALVLHGCASAPPESRFDAVADVKQVMAGILEPAAEVYWDAVGTIIDTAGVQEIAPRTDAEWTVVRHAALVIAESGNLLNLEGRIRDRDRWIALSRALVDAGRVALGAAERQDARAVFDAGGRVYEACTACHAAYALETLRPSDTRTDR